MMNAYPTVLTSKTAAFSFKCYWLTLLSILFGVAVSAQTSLQVNFQDSVTKTPVGWLKDYGQAFGPRTSANQGSGNTYGWISKSDNTPLDLTAYGRKRTSPADTLLATLVHMQYPNTTSEGVWQAQVVNGTYEVTVSVGDGSYTDSKHSINVEGVPAIVGFVPTTTNRFQSATVTVSVTDGLLSVDANGGTNTKINYISIKPSTTNNNGDTTNSSIVFNQSSESAEVDQGGTQSLLEYISTTDGKAVSAKLSATDANGNVPTWLSVNGKLLDGTISYTTGSEITFTFDATNLSVGTYTAKVIASSPGYTNAVLDISLTVKAGSSGTPANLKINFQDSVSKVSFGWLRDYGQAFGPRTSADQGTGNTYGWIRRSDNTPLDLTAYGRKRTSLSDTLLSTFVHMQPTSTIEGIWEAQVANGNYDVTVSVGDNDYTNSKHYINIEGVPAIINFVPTSSMKFKTATISVSVADGLLTVDAIGGTNTKIDYIVIKPSTAVRPSVVLVNPENASTNVSENTAISTSILNLPNGGINNATIIDSTVYLTEEKSGARVPAHVNGTGGGDAITLTPSSPLKLNTSYIFTITSGVKDLSGASFIPYSSTFTTGAVSTTALLDVKFDKIPLPNTVGQHTSLTIGPDGKLYALTNDGVIKRFPINADGTLGTPELIYSLQDASGTRQQRLAVGFAFDPASTATNLIAWVTNDTYTFLNAPDWDGKLTRLSGPNLENVQDVLINLPRSVKDHVTNSIAFGPDGALYFTQGSTSAMGKGDKTWGNREEHLLSAAVLRLDTKKLGTLPLDVKTKEGGGTYDPYAANAPLTIYASGVRNAYDLVWHSNGELYTPTNGSAAGGNTPASVTGTLRPDGTTYNGPAVPALTNVQQTEKDFLFKIKQGGYYGHPNPLRGEYVMNGGNPTTAIDPAQTDAYPVGTMPDANWRGYAFDFQMNKSPNGAIEYKSNVFNGALKGKLLVVRYSQNDDIITLTPGGTNNDIVSFNEGSSIQGFSGFVDPLDLTEDTRNGNIYVSEYGGDGDIVLLKPSGVTLPSNITTNPKKIYDNDVAGGTPGISRVVSIKNKGTGTLTVSGISLSGTNTDQFVLGNLPAFPKTINAQDSITFTVAFNPSTVGIKTASVDINSNDSISPTISVPLRGLGTAGLGGSNEPSLQMLLNLYEFSVAVGDDNPSTAVINSSTTVQKAPILGDEVSMQKLIKADTGAVTIEPLAVFGPTTSNPIVGFGWYLSGDSTSKKELFTVSNNPVSNGQTVNVNYSGTLSFDPGTTSFGFYSRWPYFNNRHLYSEDSLNTFSGSVPHHVRVYPYKNQSSVVPNTYIVAFEETTSALDYQDLVFVVRNVKAAPSGNIDTLSPIADAYVRNGNYSASNYGSDTSLMVKGSATIGYTRYSFLKFSLNGVSNVGSAKLRVYGFNTQSTQNVVVSAYGVNDDSWTESGITLNNAPVAATTALNSVGVNNIVQYYEMDVTDYVKSQFTGDKVVSLVVKDPNNINKALQFNSKENAVNKPQLVISTVAPPVSNALLFVENLDKFPSNDHFVTSKLQIPWTRDTVAPYTYNANHDTARVRINNKGINPLVVTDLKLSSTNDWKFLKLKGVDYNPATALPLTVNPGTYADLTLQFISSDSVSTSRIKTLQNTLTIVSNDDKSPKKVLSLTGLWQRMGEGNNEPYGQEIISAFGFKTRTGYSHFDPDTGLASKPKGDEIISSYFVRADSSKPVYVRQIAAYHSCCTITETLKWYAKGTTAYNTAFTHLGVDAQSLLARKGRPNTPADASFNPTGPFSLKVGGVYMDTLRNFEHKLGIRIYKAIDENGQLIPNTYILDQDYIGSDITNYDYQDNTYYITNVRPEIGTAYYSDLGSTPSAIDFGEKLLQSANTFNLNIQNLGKTYSNGSSDPAITISSVNVEGENSSEFSAAMPAKTTLNAQDTTTITVGFNPASEGLKIANLLIYYNNSKSPYRVPLYGIAKASGTTVTAVYRIKSGSSTAITVNGKTWSADTLYAFDNLEPYTNPQLKQINATDEDVLYLKEQSSNGDKKPFRYEMPIANGNYVVRLHFAEIYWGDPGSGVNGGPGSRVMSVSLENQLRLINLDVANEVGSGAALVKNLPVTVTDGKLNIDFSATVNRPMVMAIEVYKFDAGTNTLTKIALKESPSTQNDFEQPKVYPNPLRKRFFIQFPSVYKGDITLQMVDMTGRVFEVGKSRIRAGGSTMEVDISKLKLTSGVYFLKIFSEGRKPEIVKLLIE